MSTVTPIIEVDLTKETPSNIEVGYRLNAPYSGKSISMTLPKGRYGLECWGAQGGYRNNENLGGKGGYSRGIITLSEPTHIYIYAGGSGNSVSKPDNPDMYGVRVYPGGFNGGGKRGSNPGGGGASDIRIGRDSLYARVIVAGGGGSDGGPSYRGGAGGGNTGETVNNGTSSTGYGNGGFGGTMTGNSSGETTWQQVASSQSEAAAFQVDCYSGFGFGGNGVYANGGYGGAGGGGWYGGTGAMPDSSADDDKAGGGGSGYIYISDTAGIYPSGCLLDSSMYLDEATTIAGNKPFESPSGVQETGHSGDGYVRISVLDIESQPPQPATKFYLKINGSWRVVA